ncbi:hypothetical protein RUM43_010182 [Polyplax serrata]|uniref:Uncharacterized protein n=1 Tax=Polyplax serrata TaxID=468196 RepID=A0AAN8S9X9_POLSC
MEFKPTADEGEEVSSSQDTICLLKPSKRETESMEDFVDLTKDISSVKDITTQFLQSETNERNQNQSYDSLMSFGENDVKLNDREQVFFDLTSNATDSIVDSNELTSALDAFSYGDRDDVKAYFDGNSGKKIHQDEYNNFMNFEQDEGIYTTNSNDSGEPFIHNENMKGNLVTDISDYTADDVHTHYDIPNAPQDLFFTKNKGENMPVSHQTDFENDNAQSWQVPESKSDKTKESALNPPASQLPKPREEETTRLHGEGINTRETDDGDMSDGDDIVPEPIPKDYPEIGAFTGKELLAAVGIELGIHNS